MTYSWTACAERMAEKPTYKWWVLAVVQCSMILIGIDSTVVNLALPTVSKELQASVSLSQWAISGFLLAAAIALPLAGRCSDLFGRKKTYLVGFALFTISSLFCAIATSVEMLIGMRMVQGMGAAALLANSNAITAAIFPHRQHGLAMSVNNTIFSLGIALGVTLGGYLIEYVGWRAIFFINLPFGIFAILLGLFILIEKRIAVSRRDVHRMDYWGAILSILVIGGIMGGLELRMNSLGPAYFSHLLIFGGLLLLPVLIITELRMSFPLLDMRLYKIPSFSIGLVVRFLLSSINYSIVFMLAFYTQRGLSYSPLQSGLVMISYAVSNLVVGPIGGHLSDRFGAKLITTLGFLIEALALVCLMTLALSVPGENLGWTPAKLVTGMFLHGIGMAFIAGPNNSSTLRSVPSAQTGVSAGLLFTIAFLGGALSTAFCASGLPKDIHLKLASSLSGMKSILHAQTRVFLLLLLLVFMGCVLCLIRKTTASRP
jgi:EmrB/QacA subfamily drug resistance transporter